MCGRNTTLKDRLEKELEEDRLQSTALSRCTVLGYIQAQEKSELMNICSLMIGKPGGATTAEVSALRLPLLMFYIQRFCEEGNKEKLAETNLLYEYVEGYPLPLQIEEVLNKIESFPIHVEDPDWKTILLEKLEELR